MEGGEGEGAHLREGWWVKGQAQLRLLGIAVVELELLQCAARPLQAGKHQRIVLLHHRDVPRTVRPGHQRVGQEADRTRDVGLRVGDLLHPLLDLLVAHSLGGGAKSDDGQVLPLFILCMQHQCGSLNAVQQRCSTMQVRNATRQRVSVVKLRF